MISVFVMWLISYHLSPWDMTTLLPGAVTVGVGDLLCPSF